MLVHVIDFQLGSTWSIKSRLKKMKRLQSCSGKFNQIVRKATTTARTRSVLPVSYRSFRNNQHEEKDQTFWKKALLYGLAGYGAFIVLDLCHLQYRQWLDRKTHSRREWGGLALDEHAIQQLKQVFERYSKGNDRMTLEEFKEFLKVELYEELSPEELTQRINSVKTVQDGEGTFVYFDEFMDYIMRQETNPFWMRESVRGDRPLSEYFVSSSHNTYLVGNQLTSESSAKAYIDCLKSNCRCIESM